ncbi:MAG: sigma 54-interacting transcriptional regulator [Myxococcota bacterium]
MIGLLEISRPGLARTALAHTAQAVVPLCDSAEALAAIAEDRISGLIAEVEGLSDLEPQLLGTASRARLPVLVVARDRSIGAAVEALRAGASDYLASPFEVESFQRAVDRLTCAARAPEISRRVRDAFVTSDPELRETLDLVASIAATDATLLIEGESGTGKELLARFVHERSARCDRELVSINCAALPAGLLESELFGHERGAFTGAFARVLGKFELAHGTTILLDEIGELELGLQAKLLRVLQEKQVQRLGARAPVDVDFRLVATTNRNLASETRAGRFREDLYYRLNVIPVRLKPLRERIEDIPLLIRHFVATYARRNDSMPRFTPAALRALSAHAWPGNVRELENLVQRVLLTLPGRDIAPADLGLGGTNLAPEPRVDAPPKSPARDADGESAHPPLGTIREMERWLIGETLRRMHGNRTRASRELGISLRTLRNKIHEYAIDDPDTLPRTGVGRSHRARQFLPGAP